VQTDRWRLGVTVAVVVSLVLGLAALGVGIEAYRHRGHAKVPPVPATTIVVPKPGATVSGVTALAAVPIGPNVSAVEFVATGGPLHGTKIATGAPSLDGLLATWNTTTVPNGTYDITSVGYSATGASATGPAIVVVVHNGF
jgi:hypothetical protein